jgi:hypothetical protein
MRLKSGMFTFQNFNESPLPQRAGSDSTADITQIQGDIERLYFITEALWRIIKEKHGLQDEEIIRQITVIDMEDGKLDSRKAKTPPQPCPKCGRTLGRQRNKCLFCGELVAVNPFQR